MNSRRPVNSDVGWLVLLLRNVKRKIIYVAAIGLVLILGISAAALRFHPPRTFRVVSMDGFGGGGAGFGGRGLGCSMKTWKSSDGIEVFEESISYATAEDAQKDFDAELKMATTIHERTERPNSRRIVATFPTSSFSSKVKLITLENKEIRYVEASSLQSVLAFDQSWFKYDQ
jgi:hypothetical protein